MRLNSPLTADPYQRATVKRTLTKSQRDRAKRLGPNAIAFMENVARETPFNTAGELLALERAHAHASVARVKAPPTRGASRPHAAPAKPKATLSKPPSAKKTPVNPRVKKREISVESMADLYYAMLHDATKNLAGYAVCKAASALNSEHPELRAAYIEAGGRGWRPTPIARRR